LVESIPELKQHLRGAKVISRERGAITTTRRLRHVIRGNVALVGDASGSADAITGEGLALGFRQASLLAEAVAADDLSLYQRGHASMMRLPQTMARIMLLMDRWPLLRLRALRALAADPALFQSMLDVHLGEKPLRQFLLRQAPGFGLRLLRTA
jgi:flavin-dependent dehydrogenase